MEVTGSFTFRILSGHKTGLGKNVFYGMKKIAVEMEDIIDEMFAHGPKTFSCFNILLATVLAITTGYNGSAVQTIPFLTLWMVGHAKFFLKIGTKTRVKILFSLSPKAFSIFDRI